MSALETRKKDDKDAGYEYTLRPILFIVPKGSPPTAFEAKRREAEALKARFQNCEEGITFARGLRDVAVRAPVIRNSADLPAPLRGVLDGIQIGRLTNPEQTAQGIEVFALCGKKESKADSPGKREVRDEIFAQSFQTQANSVPEADSGRCDDRVPVAAHDVSTLGAAFGADARRAGRDRTRYHADCLAAPRRAAACPPSMCSPIRGC